jgi:glycerol-3-phosphate acyltransferase PlsX
MMGGDHKHLTTLPAVANFLAYRQDAILILVGTPEISSQVQHAISDAYQERWHWVEATQEVHMEESPQAALKNKKDSSMRRAIEQVRDGHALAAVSAGNTGALMAVARFILKTLPGIDRPAIAKMMPTLQNHYCCVLDLGANVESTPEQLCQFAMMGSALYACVFQRERPRIGLLNVGTEPIKGTEISKKTHEQLSQLNTDGFHFIGNVEGNDLFSGKADVIVCDGFAGNIALKASEGAAKYIAHSLHATFKHNFFYQILGIFAYPVLRHFKKAVDPRKYNGASFLGLRGTVIKSHGSADSLAFFYALEQAYQEAIHQVIPYIEQKLHSTPLPPTVNSTASQVE